MSIIKSNKELLMFSGIANKTVMTARGVGGGTDTQNCSISSTGSLPNVKTLVTLITPVGYPTPPGFVYTLGINSGETKGDLLVKVNGQEIERNTGSNNVINAVVYDEVNTTSINIYQVNATGTQALASDTLIEIQKIYFYNHSQSYNNS